MDTIADVDCRLVYTKISKLGSQAFISKMDSSAVNTPAFDAIIDQSCVESQVESHVESHVSVSKKSCKRRDVGKSGLMKSLESNQQKGVQKGTDSTTEVGKVCVEEVRTKDLLGEDCKDRDPVVEKFGQSRSGQVDVQSRYGQVDVQKECGQTIEQRTSQDQRRNNKLQQSNSLCNFKCCCGGSILILWKVCHYFHLFHIKIYDFRSDIWYQIQV